MTAMSESLVDLSYRGLALGKRIKLTQVRASAGYLEVSAPMPVGATIGIATDEGVLLEATVTEVREQTTAGDRTPGMVVRPKLEAETARTWWKQRVTMADDTAAPQPDADGKVTVRSRRMSGHPAIPELVDDGRNTAVMQTMNDAAADGVLAESTDPSLPRISQEITAQNPIVDDGKRTTMMNAIDLEALGLDPSASSGSMAAVTDEDSGGSGTTDKPDGGSGKAKKKRRRR
jgi:hypothetical protein